MDNTAITLAAQIVAAYVGNNRVDSNEILKLLGEVHQGILARMIEKEKPKPVVPITKSIFPNHIVCLDDGVELKMLKRHLREVHGLSPEQYREKWGLSKDYPMTAPNYAKVRSKLAKQGGLGRNKIKHRRAA